MAKAVKATAVSAPVTADGDAPLSNSTIDASAAITSPDGVGIYVGERNALRQRHGTGWAYLPNGDFYKGTYDSGQRHGYGLYVHRCGARYIGNYQRNIKQGTGSYYHTDGSVYAGDWQANARHGFGRYAYANGDRYEGEWHWNQRHGIGTYTFSAINGSYRFCGTWVDGVAMGATEIATDKYRLYCDWRETAAIGAAVFVFGCKEMALGHFEEVSETTIDVNDATKLDSKENVLEETYDNSTVDGNADVEVDATSVPKVKLKSRWVCQELKAYDSAAVPSGPRPQPIQRMDNEMENIPQSPSPSGVAFAYRDRDQCMNANMIKTVFEDVLQKTIPQLSVNKTN